MSHSFTRGARRAAAVGVTAGLSLTGLSLALAVGGATPASATSTPTGRAHLTSPNGSPLPTGALGSLQQFTASLDPQGALPAHCQGDTATNHYHEFSYLLPDGSDPTTVNFLTGAPSTGAGFYDSTGKIWEAKNTAASTGQFLNIPLNLQWGTAVSTGHLPKSMLLPGPGSTNVMEAGFACADPTGTVNDYWFSELTFTASTSDPNGFTWAPTTRSTTTSVACPASAAALTAVSCTVTVTDTSATPEQPVSGNVNVAYTGATTPGASCTLANGACSVSVAGAKATIGSNAIVAATYVGGDNNNHLTSSGSTTFAITKIVTHLAATPVVHVAVPPFATATLSDAVEGGIPGKTVVFTAGGPNPATCTATTGAGGVATCTDPLFLVSAVANLGFTTSFAGDATYVASNGSAGLV